MERFERRSHRAPRGHEPRSRRSGWFAAFSFVGLAAVPASAQLPLDLSPACAPAERPAPMVENPRASPELLVGERHPLPGLLTGGLRPDTDLERLAAAGVRTLVDLRTAAEIEPGFAAAALDAGLAYFALPIAGEADLDLGAARALHEILSRAEARPVALACASGNRSGALLAVERFWLGGESPQDALRLGRDAGLTRLEPSVRLLLGVAPPQVSATPSSGASSPRPR